MRVHARGARGGRAVSAHRAAAERGRRTGRAHRRVAARGAVRVARAGAAARSNNPRAALALLDGAWLRCRDERDRAALLAEAERLHAAAVAASTFEAAALDAWPDAGDAAGPPAMNTQRETPPSERAVAAWPAVTRWRSPRYWIAELGARIVPVEVGVEHRDSDLAQQRLVPFGEYVDSVLLPLARGEAASLGGNVCAVSEVVPVTSARTVAYLAQHPLLEQCPQPSRETPRPGRGSCRRPRARAARWPRFVQDPIVSRARECLEPKCLRLGGLPIAAPARWLHSRPATRCTTIIPCHVVGRKLVYLWPPDAPIPRNAPPAENTSPLDAASIVDACDLRADLRPGDVLFIPGAGGTMSSLR